MIGEGRSRGILVHPREGGSERGVKEESRISEAAVHEHAWGKMRVSTRMTEDDDGAIHQHT